MDRSFFRDLTTERLLLKNVSREDADIFFKVFSHPIVTEYLMDNEPFQSIADAEQWIGWYTDDNPDHNRWIIVNIATGFSMGTCGFHGWDRRNRRVEIGYDLLPEYWENGYMNAALREAVGFGFRDMEVNRICAYIHLDNLRSVRLAEKLGFQREGLLRDYCFSGGMYHDHCLYSLLKREYTGES